MRGVARSETSSRPSTVGARSATSSRTSSATASQQWPADQPQPNGTELLRNGSDRATNTREEDHDDRFVVAFDAGACFGSQKLGQRHTAESKTPDGQKVASAKPIAKAALIISPDCQHGNIALPGPEHRDAQSSGYTGSIADGHI